MGIGRLYNIPLHSLGHKFAKMPYTADRGVPKQVLDWLAHKPNFL